MAAVSIRACLDLCQACHGYQATAKDPFSRCKEIADACKACVGLAHAIAVLQMTAEMAVPRGLHRDF
jgi:hypothetical protein